MPEPEVVYIYDPSVDANLDWKIRVILGTCFGDLCFRQQRFCTELPAHRWVIYGTGDIIAAHVAIHIKVLGSEQGDIKAGGVAEVCVHPDYRGRRLTRRLLTAAEDYMRENGIDFSALFGDAKVYSSAGYRQQGNPLRYYEKTSNSWECGANTGFMVKELTGRKWPQGTIDLRGPKF